MAIENEWSAVLRTHAAGYVEVALANIVRVGMGSFAIVTPCGSRRTLANNADWAF